MTIYDWNELITAFKNKTPITLVSWANASYTGHITSIQMESGDCKSWNVTLCRWDTNTSVYLFIKTN